MEKFSLSCPSCNQKLEYDEDMFGLQTCCPNLDCDQILNIPNGPPGSPSAAATPTPDTSPEPTVESTEDYDAPLSMDAESGSSPETDYVRANDTQFRNAAEAAAEAPDSEDVLAREVELDALAPKPEKSKKFTPPPPKVIVLAVLLLAVLGFVAKSLMPGSPPAPAPEAGDATPKAEAADTAKKAETTQKAAETAMAKANETVKPATETAAEIAPVAVSPTIPKINATPAVAAVKPPATAPAVTNEPAAVVEPPKPKKDYKFFSIRAISGSKERPIVILNTGSNNYDVMAGDKLDVKTPDGKMTIQCVSIENRVVKLLVDDDEETTTVYAP